MRIEERFGQHVGELRRKAGLTQEELAERADVHRTYLAGIEAGRRNVGLVNLVYLAKGLGVDAAALVAPFTTDELRRLPRNHRNATRSRREK
jgi:transcriptional regulator with XRE-family HTH domain